MTNPNLPASSAAAGGLRGALETTCIMAAFTEGLDVNDPKDLELVRQRYDGRVKAVADARERGEMK
jgi:hypothetical protein